MRWLTIFLWWWETKVMGRREVTIKEYKELK